MAPKKKALPNPLPDGLIVTDTEKKSWKLGKVIGSGGFGLIYLASQAVDAPVRDDTNFVIKVEYHENGPLFSELKFYQRAAKPESMLRWKKAKGLDFLGIPTYWGSGLFEHTGTRYRFMAMDRLGTDMQKVLEKCGGSFPKHTVLELGCLLLDVLEYIHDNEYVHADIKAANLLLDVRQPGKVYLADYGLAYRYNPAGVHKEYKENPKKGYNGTIEYTSTDAHKGVAPSRRGDLEILGYCLLHWLSGTLPWLPFLRDPTRVQEAKAKLMSNLPDSVTQLSGTTAGSAELARFMLRVKALGYEDRPDYQALKLILSEGVPKALRGQGLLDLHRARPEKAPEPSVPKPAGQAKPPARRTAKPKPVPSGHDVSDEDSPKPDLRRTKPPGKSRGQGSRQAKPAGKKITTLKPAVEESSEEDDDYASSEEEDDDASDEEEDAGRGPARGRGLAVKAPQKKKTGPVRRRGPRMNPVESDEDYDPGPECRGAQPHRGAATAVDNLCPALEKKKRMPNYTSRRPQHATNVPRIPSQHGRSGSCYPAAARDTPRNWASNGHAYPPSNHCHNHWREHPYDQDHQRRNHTVRRGHSYQYSDQSPAYTVLEDYPSCALATQAQERKGRNRWFNAKVLGAIVVLVFLAVAGFVC